MFSANSLQLTPNSTLADLPSHNFRIKVNLKADVIEAQFLEHPEIPAVIIVEADGDEVISVISRSKFFEIMSQEYSRGVFLRRSIDVLLSIFKYRSLEIASDSSIDEAINITFSRPPNEIYEPIVVLHKNGDMRILEVNLLVLAQSQISAQVNKIIRTQKEWAQKYADSLKKEQEKVIEYTQKLETEQAEAQRRNQILEQQQEKLSQQTQQISQLNEQFIQIGHLLSSEGKKTFQEMLKSVKAICGSTQKVVEIEQAFSNELAALNDALGLIERVSQQVRRLSVQASVLSRNGEDREEEGQLSGLRLITTEIDSLGNKTLEATSQINQIANQFKFQINQLTNAVQGSENVARSLVNRSQKTQNAIAQLEELLGNRISSNIIETHNSQYSLKH